jgi:hypothetical protein
MDLHGRNVQRKERLDVGPVKLALVQGEGHGWTVASSFANTEVRR